MKTESDIKELIVHILNVGTVDLIKVLHAISLVQGPMEVQKVYRGILSRCNQDLGKYTSGMDRVRGAHRLVNYQRGITVSTLEEVLCQIYSEYATGEHGRIIALINFITELHPDAHAGLREYVFIPEYSQVVEAIYSVITDESMTGDVCETAVRIIDRLPPQQLLTLDDFIGYVPSTLNGSV